MTQQQLEKYLWGAATYLRGHMDAGDNKQYIFPLLFFKRICDVYDEEYEQALDDSGGDLDYASFAENHRFKVPDGSHWKDVRSVTRNVGPALQQAMHNLEKANQDQLFGIFGDAPWTNKDRLSDETLINLVEHLSQHSLSIKNVPQDELGNAYEYLIKQFADDSGHTAAEFYTNRTVVRLMTLIADPQPGESVYDPTCGSGGLLLNCALQLKNAGKEYRSLKLYGQEINLITSSIARMNMFMHGIEDFQVVRGNTLTNPAFLEDDRLKQFDIILANPPYSIKAWDQSGFVNDSYGRNIWGTPPQGCADYAFQQHIHKSLDPKTGRCVILWPHGILFRDHEKGIRRNMILTDTVEAVIALGKNLFYNSSMESSLLVCNNRKTGARKNNILFINAFDEIRNEKNIAYLDDKHIDKILSCFTNYQEILDFSTIVNINDIVARYDSSLHVTKYVKSHRIHESDTKELPFLLDEWDQNSKGLRQSIVKLLSEIKTNNETQ